MCFGFIIASIVGFICLLVYGNDVYHVFPFSVLNYGYSNILYVGAFALVFIPLLAIALLTIRVIFNGNALGRSTAYTMLIIWVCALSLVIYYSAKITGQFRDEASFSQTINIKPTRGNVYHLTLNDVKYLTHEDSLQMDINGKFSGRIILDDRRGNDMMPRNVSIDIERSDVNQVVLVESFSAKGARYESALKNAQNSIYNFSQRDSVLTFDRRLLLPKGSLWRDQEVELTLKVPYGVTLIIDEDLANMMRRGINLWDCKQQNKTPDAQTAPFIMTNDGLQCKIDTLPQAIVAPPAK